MKREGLQTPTHYWKQRLSVNATKVCVLVLCPDPFQKGSGHDMYVCTCVSVRALPCTSFSSYFYLSFFCKCPSLEWPDLPLLPAGVWFSRDYKCLLLDLPYIPFILPQRSLIGDRLASTDRNTSNALGSTAIRESTAASRSEVLLPLSCIVLVAASRTAAEMMFSAYSSHAKTSGSCMAMSRSAECLRNVS